MQGLMKWGELAPAIKRSAANLQMLNVEATLLPPFAGIRNLGDAVELRITKCIQSGAKKAPVAWLIELAANLCRIKLAHEEESTRVRTLAQRLFQTERCPFAKLEVTPYVDGQPAGEPFAPKALWHETTLFVSNISAAKLHKNWLMN